MSNWSPENATRAYLRALKMGKQGKEPDVAEFISALAAGNNAQLMVEICGGAAGSTTLALVAAAQQTGGRVVCIVPSLEEVSASRHALGSYLDRVEIVVAKGLTDEEYKGADFVLVDCHVDSGEILRAAAGKEGGGCVVVGYNAGGDKVAGVWSELKGHYLPIGDGLLVARVGGGVGGGGWRCGGGGRRSKWVVKVDKYTGEEHVFRITSPQHKVIPTGMIK